MLLWAAVALALGGCAPDDGTARGVAERFIDAHYVRIDLAASREYTSGLAREKVDDEIRLTQGQVIDEGTHVPRVSYELTEERLRGSDTVSFAYAATLSVDGGEPIDRTFQLTLRNGADGWRVTNYSEY
jgi:hypothetical protein